MFAVMYISFWIKKLKNEMLWMTLLGTFMLDLLKVAFERKNGTRFIPYVKYSAVEWF
jgi:hypothetical protein